METYEILGKLIGVAKLRKMQDKTEEGEERDMWKAVEDLIEEGRTEGRIHPKAHTSKRKKL